jgi:hypothetical protein
MHPGKLDPGRHGAIFTVNPDGSRDEKVALTPN